MACNIPIFLSNTTAVNITHLFQWQSVEVHYGVCSIRVSTTQVRPKTTLLRLFCHPRSLSLTLPLISHFHSLLSHTSPSLQELQSINLKKVGGWKPFTGIEAVLIYLWSLLIFPFKIRLDNSTNLPTYRRDNMKDCFFNNRWLKLEGTFLSTLAFNEMSTLSVFP